MRKKVYIFVVLFAVVVTFFGCKKSENPTGSADNNRLYPSFLVENVQVFSGENDVVLDVKLNDNPGFLTMAMYIEFDPKVMTLTDVRNGSNYQDYNFVGPRNYASGCCAGWFLSELPDEIVDGKLLELHFSIAKDAKSGIYPVFISIPDNGGIVDGNKEIIVVTNAVGYVNVE